MEETESKKAGWRPTWVGVVQGCAWLYVPIVLAVWFLIRFGGDRWWLATVVLFGARWIYGLPLLLLVPAAAILRRRLLLPLAASAIVVIGPIAGLCLPLGLLFVPAGPALRVLTCNVKGKCAHNEALEKLINTAKPDIVALQGCWADVEIRWPSGWHVCQQEDFIIASRFPLVHDGTDHRWRRPGHGPQLDMLHCIVQTPQREIDFCSVHLLSPREGITVVLDRQTVLGPSRGPALAAEIQQRSEESKDAGIWTSRLSQSPIVAGDFNMPTDSSLYRRDWGNYRNAFSDAGLGFGYTEWPRIRGLSWGVRIDHVLMGSGWCCLACWVGADIGSDHLPLVADLAWDSRGKSQ
jgi:vancomycin resistance protein VanJ